MNAIPLAIPASWRKELQVLAWMTGVFLLAYFLPLSNDTVQHAIQEAFKLLQWYVRNHTLACVVPAMFIAGAVTTFLSKEIVLRHLGPTSSKPKAYGVASVSGTVLAVCSCSVLPVFAGIHRLGAGLGPAIAFLYSGPAINVLAIFLTARVLGMPIGIGRAVGAIVFSIVIGWIMAMIFHREESVRVREAMAMPEAPPPSRPLWKTSLLLSGMVAFLVISDWYNPGNVVVTTSGGQTFSAISLQETRDEVVYQLEAPWNDRPVGAKFTLPKTEIATVREADTWVIWLHHRKWWFAGAVGGVVLLMVWRWLDRTEISEWMGNTWDFSKQIVPLLFGGVFAVGFVGALIPETTVARWVGDNSLSSNLAASVIGAFWYFATLTEIPICEALGKLGMHQGPMLTLLLAGPALSLPSILVLKSVMGWRKTLSFTGLVIGLATLTGWAFGALI
ncbi:MAG: permease [Verrucomicrobiales bacterium]|nr:permease [Verrucomicrobiales bacterium]